MTKIDLEFFECSLPEIQKLEIARSLNEIMDYLEHMHAKNGKLFICVNCRHATGYIGDLGKCCDNPLYEVSD